MEYQRRIKMRVDEIRIVIVIEELQKTNPANCQNPSQEDSSRIEETYCQQSQDVPIE